MNLYRNLTGRWLVILAFCSLEIAPRAQAQTWRYQLIEGSSLLDECPPCARPSIPLPMRGSMELTREPGPAPLERFRIENVVLHAGSTFGREYKITGGGTYEVFSEFAVIARLHLELLIDDGTGPRLCLLSSDPGPPGRLWPMLEAAAVQTNGTFTQVYHLQLAAAPFVELWYSLNHGLHNGNWSFPTNAIRGGDLLALEGRVVRRAESLLARFQPAPPLPNPDIDPGLDAADVWAGGQIAFSIDEPMFSKALGKTVQPGDLLSDRGEVLASNQALTKGFGFMPPVPDLGLDALQRLETGELYFSLADDQFSERLGVQIGRGDVLSDTGRIVRRNKELLARFHPKGLGKDYGLDALHVWPSGEIWFSTEVSFEDEELSHVGEGDLLSDQGYIVLRHRELVTPFAPLEDLADFGLDGLFVLTDVAAIDTPPHFTSARWDSVNGGLELNWEAKGKVFQVEKAARVEGPYRPVSSPNTDLGFVDHTVNRQSPAGFYRLRQW